MEIQNILTVLLVIQWSFGDLCPIYTNNSIEHVYNNFIHIPFIKNDPRIFMSQIHDTIRIPFIENKKIRQILQISTDLDNSKDDQTYQQYTNLKIILYVIMYFLLLISNLAALWTFYKDKLLNNFFNSFLVNLVSWLKNLCLFCLSLWTLDNFLNKARCHQKWPAGIHMINFPFALNTDLCLSFMEKKLLTVFALDYLWIFFHSVHFSRSWQSWF